MSRLEWQAVVAGVGGQGVLFVSRALSTAVEPKAGSILISEVHGMAQRGGAVVSHLKAGPFSGPLVSPGQADLLLALDPGEAVRNLSYLVEGAGWWSTPRTWISSRPRPARPWPPSGPGCSRFRPSSWPGRRARARGPTWCFWARRRPAGPCR